MILYVIDDINVRVSIHVLCVNIFNLALEKTSPQDQISNVLRSLNLGILDTT